MLIQSHKLKLTLPYEKSPISIFTKAEDVSKVLLASLALYPGCQDLVSAQSWYEDILRLNLDEGWDFSEEKEIVIPKEHWFRFGFVFAFILTFFRGNVECPECKKTYTSTDLHLNHWAIRVAALSGTGGKEILCPERHQIFKTVDWRS